MCSTSRRLGRAALGEDGLQSHSFTEGEAQLSLDQDEDEKSDTEERDECFDASVAVEEHRPDAKRLCPRGLRAARCNT